ncbi:MAG: prepilin-type N-terminal cleavage/methylation domain-containing protein [Pyrinomonadaceae bacterium]
MRTHENGYSLLELLLVLALLSLIAAFVVNTSYTSGGSGEALIIEAARRTRQRRAEAVQLNAATGTNSIERSFSQPPLIIDFSLIETTKMLRLEGAGATRLTCPNTHPRTSTGLCEKINEDHTRERVLGTWSYQYLGNAMPLTNGWSVALSAADLVAAAVPQMAETRLTTQLRFTSNGRVQVDPNPDVNAQPAASWAIYFTKGNAARALSLTDSGQVEICRWENGQWLGFGDRIITSANTPGAS